MQTAPPAPSKHTILSITLLEWSTALPAVSVHPSSFIRAGPKRTNQSRTVRKPVFQNLTELPAGT